MTEKIKSIILYTLLTLITASIGITSLISNIFKGTTIYILLGSLACIIIFIAIIDFDNLKIKELINNTFIRVISIIYLILSLLYILTILGVLINNLFYVITPMTISLAVITILIVILSFNKRIININIFFILSIICSLFLVFFLFLFPNSNLKLDLITPDVNSIYFYSYSIIISDLIFYKSYLSTNTSKIHSKALIFSCIIALILLSFYTYLDLTITNINYTNTPFKNILKYQLVLPNSNIYFDLLYLVIVIVIFVFKMIIFGENLRCFLFCKKTFKTNFIIYLVIFLIGNTLINQIKNETGYLYILLSILTCFSIILIIMIGGCSLVKRIYQHTKK